MHSILWILLFLLAGYFIILLLMYSLQSKMIYHPSPRITQTPAELGITYEDIQFKAEDGPQLHGWFVSSDTAKATVLFFHGNAGNISHRLGTIQLLHALDVNLFIIDYRGYGKSEGTPTESGTYRDARAAWHYLTEERGIPAGQIAIMGRSLGGAVAAQLATTVNPAAVIIESTFTSAADLGAELYPWLPVQRLLKFEYATLQAIEKIKSPIFFAHSRDDEIVPFHHGKELYAAASEPKVFVPLEGAHAGGFAETGASYRNALRDFLDTHVR